MGNLVGNVNDLSRVPFSIERRTGLLPEVPAIPPIRTNPVVFEDPIMGLDQSLNVAEHHGRIAKMLTIPDKFKSAISQMNILPVFYVTDKLDWESAATAAKFLYGFNKGNEVQVEKDLLLKLSADIVNNRGKIKELEGGDLKKLTLGGKIEPGINMDDLNGAPDYAMSLVKKVLIRAARENVLALSKMFPHLALPPQSSSLPRARFEAHRVGGTVKDACCPSKPSGQF